MKSRKRTAKTLENDVIIKSFMSSPFPMVISKAKDGVCVEVNEAGTKLWGLPRKQLIGHSSMELGFLTEKQRKLLHDEVRKQGFAGHIPVQFNIKKHGLLRVFINVFTFKMGKESFLLSAVNDVSKNNVKNIGQFLDDKFTKITRQHRKIIKEKLKEYPLTPRQKEIAFLFAVGNSNGEITKKLNLSEYTVKGHMKDIFRTTGIKNRSELFPKLLNLR